MNSEEGAETIEKKFKPHSRRPTQELSGITPKSIREQAKVENKNPAQIVEASLRLGGMINTDEQIENIGPGKIEENGEIILSSEVETTEGKTGTEFKRGTVTEMEDDLHQGKIFRLQQPVHVPTRKGHTILTREVTEPIGLKDLRDRFQKGEALVFKVIPSQTKRK